MQKQLMEKIKIFLTDQWRSRTKISEMSSEVMLTVEDFYKNPERADDYRNIYGLTFRNTMGLDSGGFQILMGKWKGPMEPLPCGIDVPPNAQQTIELYKRTGLEPHDLPVQLDIPPRYDIPPEHRKQLLERSACYYYEMLPEIRGLVPVIHGWTKEEVLYSLRLIEDPDIVAAGTNQATSARNKSGFISVGTNKGAANEWTMGNMNPYREIAIGSMNSPDKSAVDYVHSSKVATGVFGYPQKSAVDFVNYHNNPLGIPDVDMKKIAVGSFKGLNTVDYNDYTVSRGIPKMRALGTNLGATTNYIIDHVTSEKKAISTPAPGRLDLGIDIPLIDKIVSTPVQTKVEAGISPPDNRPARKRKEKNKEKKPKKKKIPPEVIIDRLVMVSELLCEEYEVFFLGGASPHMQHQLFMLGGKWTDTSAWRIKGLLGEIYLPEVTERGIGYSKKTRRMDDDDRERLKECLQDSTHPFCGMNVDRFLEIGRMLMPEWYDTWPKNRWEVKPFELRCYHNAWMLKFVEEPIANDLSQDPDAYYQYLRKRLEQDNHPKLVKRLDYLAELSGLKRSGQTSLEIFIKERKE